MWPVVIKNQNITHTPASKLQVVIEDRKEKNLNKFNTALVKLTNPLG